VLHTLQKRTQSVRLDDRRPVCRRRTLTTPSAGSFSASWLITGADSISPAEHEVADPEEQIGAYRDPSASLAPDETQTTGNRR